QTVSVRTRRRLALLTGVLTRCQTARITSMELSALTGWSDTVIRHDLWAVGCRAGASNGYDCAMLRDAIVRALELPRDDVRCCIVGLGQIGAALLDVNLFGATCFHVVAGFDANVNRTEILRAPFPLYPASRLEAVVLRERIAYALLAVRDVEAVPMARRLAACGIRGIVNYTNALLPPCAGVTVEYAAPALLLLLVAAAQGHGE
ncbi:MAG: CoA-binding protein, partial [Treponema sp.]|nr:CoA-binding protein [Treponema sp.]